MEEKLNNTIKKLKKKKENEVELTNRKRNAIISSKTNLEF